MEVTQKSVKQWLKKTDRTRPWLAEQCEVELFTVNNWLSTSRGIPKRAESLIDRLMSEDARKEAEAQAPTQNLVLEFTVQEFDAISEAALSDGLKPKDWSEKQLLLLAQQDMSRMARRLHRYLPREEPAFLLNDEEE